MKTAKKPTPSPVVPAAPTATAGPWILDARFDLPLMVAAPLWIFPLLYFLGAVVTDRKVNDGVAAIGAIGHHLPGMLRAYGDRQLFQRFKLRFIASPIFLAVLCVSFTNNALHGVVLLAFLWGVWHAIAQTYGFARIYAGKAGAGDRASGRADLWLLITWFVTAVLLSPLRLAFILEMATACGLPLPSAEGLHAMRGVALGAAGVATLVWLSVVIGRARAGAGPGGIRLLLLGTSIAFWWFANVRIHHLLLALPLFEVFHDSQYLTIVWIYNRRRAEKGGDISPALTALFKPTLISVALFAGACFAYGALSFYPTTSPLGETVNGLVAASQLLHFYYDGFIWKVREPQTGSVLQVTTTEAAKPSLWNRWPAMRHAVLWGIFVVPCLGLAYEERDSGTPYPQRVLPVAELVPDNPIIVYSASELRWQRGDKQGAIEGFRHVLALDPSLQPVRKNLILSLVELADAAYNEGDYKRVDELAKELEAQRPLADSEMSAFVDQRLPQYRRRP